MAKASYKSSLNSAMPLLLDLLATTAPTKSNSFVFEGAVFIRTGWLFRQPKLFPYRKIRHGLTQSLKEYAHFDLFENEDGFATGVAVYKYGGEEKTVTDPDEETFPSAFDVMTAVLSAFPLDLPFSASGSECHVFPLDLPFSASGSECHVSRSKAALRSLPAVVRRNCIRNIDELEDFFMEYLFMQHHDLYAGLVAAVVKLIRNMSPKNENCKLIHWRNTGQHKLLFRVSSVLNGLPMKYWFLEPTSSRSAFVRFLKERIQFVVIDERYVHLSDRMLKMSTEEQLWAEVRHILLAKARSLKLLHKKLSRNSKMRAATKDSLEAFLRQHKSAFVISKDDVVQLASKDAAKDTFSRRESNGVDPTEMLPSDPAELQMVERCTYLVLNGKWASDNSACTLDWLVQRLEAMPPAISVSRLGLFSVLKNHPNRFELLCVRGRIRVVVASVPFRDSSYIVNQLTGFLHRTNEQNGQTLVKIQTALEDFNGKRHGFIHLGRSLLERIVRGRPDQFKLSGDRVGLAEDFYCYTDSRDCHEEDQSGDHDQDDDPFPRSSE